MTLVIIVQTQFCVLDRSVTDRLHRVRQFPVGFYEGLREMARTDNLPCFRKAKRSCGKVDTPPNDVHPLIYICDDIICPDVDS